jgi:hypothetical protein
MAEKNPSSETLSKSRRGALKIILAGGAAGTVAALPKTWTRPVVEAVILPAHAQLSTLAASYQGTGTAIGIPSGAPVGVVDLVVPSAVAGAPLADGYTICITVEDGTAHVHVNLVNHCCSLIGDGPIGGGTVHLTKCGTIISAICTVVVSDDLKTAQGNLLFTDGNGEFADTYTADVLVGTCELTVI